MNTIPQLPPPSCVGWQQRFPHIGKDGDLHFV